MPINTTKSAKSNLRPQDFATGDEYARAQREVCAPLECHGGANCWRELGAPACSDNATNSPRCLGCNGKIRFTRYAFWPEERIAELKRLFAEGLSARQIGQQLRVSKGSVVGKLHRIGFLPDRRRT